MMMDLTEYTEAERTALLAAYAARNRTFLITGIIIFILLVIAAWALTSLPSPFGLPIGGGVAVFAFVSAINSLSRAAAAISTVEIASFERRLGYTETAPSQTPNGD
jgi:hypothetical protein